MEGQGGVKKEEVVAEVRFPCPSLRDRPETIKNALDVLHVLTVTPKSQVLLLNNVKLQNNVTTPTIRYTLSLVVLGFAGGGGWECVCEGWGMSD